MLRIWSEMTLNYQVIVERYPFSNEMVGSSIPHYKFFSLLHGKNYLDR